MSINKLQQKQLDKNAETNYIFFWNGPFSQWYHSPFVIDGRNFCTAEQWMMWNKAKMFNDIEVADKILQTTDPKKQKALGRQVKGYIDALWLEEAFDIVVQGNVAKFEQNPKLLNELRKTCGKQLVEASPYDRRWGIGMREADEGVDDPANWDGENLLGKAIDKARFLILGDC